jgi:Ca2+-binding RTX toxin-like protein
MNWLPRVYQTNLASITEKSRQKPRKAGFELLETRRQFASDLSIASFHADGSNLVVDYEVANFDAAEFSIGIYRSYNGISLAELLTTARVDVDLAVGTYQINIAGNFSDVESDYQLIAVLDCGAENNEEDQSNNQLVFSGGMFIDAQNNLQIHGTEYSDNVNIDQDSLIHVTLNGISYDYSTTQFNTIHLRAHAGNDSLYTSAAFVSPIIGLGGDGDDSFRGGSAADLFFGGLGNDQLDGAGGNDSLFGDDGNDELLGDDGDDYLSGGLGVDHLVSGAGADTLMADDGATEFYGYGDVLEAGEGDDTIYGTPGDDIILGGGGNDTIYGSDGNDQLYGGEGDDVIYGGNGIDFLDGGFGNDSLYGEAGSDVLYGSDGIDELSGGDDNDYLSGGSGFDIFVDFNSESDTASDRPEINVSYCHNDIIAKKFMLRGTVTDDESTANLQVTYSGAATGSIDLDEYGNFDVEINVENVTMGWLYLDFTDGEGLNAEQMEFCLA